VFVPRRLAAERERAGEVCERVLGLANELPREMRGL